MAKDFKASQVRTSQIIASSSLSTRPSLLILSASSAGVDSNGSVNLSAAVGEDVFVYVSGSTNSFGTTTRGVTLFGGDIVISGTAYNSTGNPYGNLAGSNKQVQFNDAGVFGASAGLTYDKNTQTLSVGNLIVTGTTTTVTSSNLVISDQVIYFGSGSKVSDTNGGIALASGSSTSNQSLVFGRVASDTWGAGRKDVAAGTSTDLTDMILVPVRSSKFELGSNNLFVSSSGNGNSLLIRSLSSNSDISIFAGPGYGTATSAVFAVTASAVKIGSVAGQSELPELGNDTFLKVSGSIGSKNTATKGVAVFGGDAVISGTTHLENSLQVTGSLSIGRGVSYGNGASHAYNSSIAVGEFNNVADQSSIAVGTGNRSGLTDGSGNNIAVGTRNIVNGTTNGAFGYENDVKGATVASFAIGYRLISSGGKVDPTYLQDSSQVVIGSYNTAKNDMSLFVVGNGYVDQDTFDTIRQDVMLVDYDMIRLGSGSRAATDVFLNISGAKGSRGTSTRGTTVIGGDLFSSGVAYFGQGLSGSLTRLLDGSPYLIAGPNITLTTGSSGAVTISSIAGTGFNDGGNKLNTTSSVAFAGGLGSSYYADNLASNVQFFVSGSKTGLGVVGTKDAVFGGNAVVSGSLRVGTGLEIVDTAPYVTYLDSKYFLNISANGGGIDLNENNLIRFITPYGVRMGAFLGVNVGSDTYLFVSGVIGSKDSNTAGTSVFGGDVVISGTLYGGSPLKVSGGLQITGTLDVSTGSKISASALSGSLTKLTDGTDYLIAGSNITLTTGSNGAVTIASTGGGGGGGADPAASYVVLNLTGSLTNERSLTQGTGIFITDVGPSDNVVLSIDNAVVATVSGTTFTGVVKANSGLSGSLTKLTDGTSYLIAGTNVTITTGSNGAVTIASTGGGGGSGTGFNDGGNKLNTTSSVAFAGGLTNGALPYYASDAGSDVFFYVSGTQQQKGNSGGKTSVFGGDVVVSGNLHGGLSFLTSDTLLSLNANNIVLYGGAVQQEATNSDISVFVSGAIGSKNGANKGTSVFGGDVVISGTLYNANGTAYSTGGGGGDSAATYVVISATGSLANERVLTAGTGISINDAGAGGNVTLSINDAIVATVSGTNFTGAVGVGSLVGPGGIASTGSLVVRAGPNNDSFFGAGCQTIHLIGTASAGHGGSIIFGDYASTYGVGIIEDIDDAILIKSKNRAQVKSTTSTINLNAGTQVLINAESVSPSPTTFTDTNFFVSGTVGSKNSANKGTAVFGGDMMISGSTYVASGSAILPVVDRGSDLGSPSKRWGNVYTGDLHLRNDRGDWTIVEEEDYLCVVNNKTGKKFKMALIPLEE